MSALPALRYSIDSSSLINGWHKLYPPTVFEGLWEELLPGLVANGHLRASREVFSEIEKQDDDVLAWCRGQSDLFLEIDGPQQAAMRALMQDPVGCKLPMINGGRSAADPWVVVIAMCHSPPVVVVTEETRGGKRPRIPDVCTSLGLPSSNLLGVIQAEGWTFRHK